MNRSIRLQLLSALVCLPLFSGCTSVAQAEYADVGSIRAEKFSEAERARLLAPIALYPDTLLTHILIASSYPLEVVEASRWRAKHSRLSDRRLMEEAEQQGWDPSVTALVAFPNVLDRMSDDLDWTQDLGEAFIADEGAVLDSIQMLRQQADRAGNLDAGDNLVIKRQPTQIIIESPRPEVIFVPYYDPRVVYGHWRWNRYPPVYWAPFPGYLSYHRHFGWRSGISISFNFYFSNFHWHQRHVIVHRHHHFRRPPEPRYAISHGAQRWRHDPGHRRGVAYRSVKVRQQYPTTLPSRKLLEKQRRDSGLRNHSNIRDTRPLRPAQQRPDIKPRPQIRERDRLSVTDGIRSDNHKYQQQRLTPRPERRTPQASHSKDPGQRPALESQLRQRQSAVHQNRHSQPPALKAQFQQRPSTLHHNRAGHQPALESQLRQRQSAVHQNRHRQSPALKAPFQQRQSAAHRNRVTQQPTSKTLLQQRQGVSQAQRAHRGPNKAEAPRRHHQGQPANNRRQRQE